MLDEAKIFDLGKLLRRVTRYVMRHIAVFVLANVLAVAVGIGIFLMLPVSYEATYRILLKDAGGAGNQGLIEEALTGGRGPGALSRDQIEVISKSLTIWIDVAERLRSGAGPSRRAYMKLEELARERIEVYVPECTPPATSDSCWHYVTRYALDEITRGSDDLSAEASASDVGGIIDFVVTGRDESVVYEVGETWYTVVLGWSKAYTEEAIEVERAYIQHVVDSLQNAIQGTLDRIALITDTQKGLINTRSTLELESNRFKLEQLNAAVSRALLSQQSNAIKKVSSNFEYESLSHPALPLNRKRLSPIIVVLSVIILVNTIFFLFAVYK